MENEDYILRKEYVKKMYQGRTWKDRVDTMPRRQVEAIYKDLKKRENKLYLKEIENEYRKYDKERFEKEISGEENN